MGIVGVLCPGSLHEGIDATRWQLSRKPGAVHILLSSDFANTTQIKATWGNGFSTVLVQFVPKLRYFCVPDESIHKILVDNSRWFLAFEPTAS